MGADALRAYDGSPGIYSGAVGSSVPIAVMDTGLNINHLDIASHRDSICGANFAYNSGWYGPDGPVGRKNPIRWNFGQAFATARRWCDPPKSPHGSCLKREFAAGWNFCALHPGSGGPSWLTFLGHSKDSLWSVDLFRCESLILRTHWVMVVLDQYTRRIVGFAVCQGSPDGPTVCRMLFHIICGSAPPTYLNSDHDPLFGYHRWKANLRILGVKVVKTVPCVPLSRPFVERVVGTVRPEYLDQTPFWTAHDLERKLDSFQEYYNRYRVHQGLKGQVPGRRTASEDQPAVCLDDYRWESDCRGLFPLPVAA